MKESERYCPQFRIIDMPSRQINDCFLQKACVLFSNRRVFLLPFPSLVLQVIENGEVYQKLKGFPALSILRWNQDGIRGAHQALRPGLHDLRGYCVLQGAIRWKTGPSPHLLIWSREKLL